MSSPDQNQSRFLSRQSDHSKGAQLSGNYLTRANKMLGQWTAWIKLKMTEYPSFLKMSRDPQLRPFCFNYEQMTLPLRRRQRPTQTVDEYLADPKPAVFVPTVEIGHLMAPSQRMLRDLQSITNNDQ